MRKPTPVLLMVRALGIGGTERQLAETARFLDRSRFEPHVACLVPEGVRRADIDRAKVPLLTLKVPSFARFSAVQGAFELGRYIRDHEIKIAHTFDGPMNVFGAPTARMAGTPIVLSSQRGHRSLTTPTFRRLQRGLDRIVDGVVVNCDAMRRHLVEEEGTRPDRIHICYNGIDTEVYFRAPAERPEKLAGRIVIGVVCALRPEKGLDTLLKAFASVLRESPSIRLLMVGSGSEEKSLKQLAVSLGVMEACHFEPGTQNVVPWLRYIDIFVLPSLSEALSNSLMEAMACGCCPVASTVGGNPELVAAGRNGLLFEPGDDADLATQLRTLIANSELRHQMAEASAQRIHTEFTHQVASDRMGQIYEDMLAKL
jgi:glycosyltransferase involved in cell wall biosynthesis